MNEPKRKKLNNRWRSGDGRYTESRIVDDEQNGDAVDELTFINRRREGPGWRNGAKLRKIP